MPTVRIAMALLIMVTTTGVGFAQDYPNKPIRIITTGVGGGGDVLTRLIAPDLGSLLGQPLVVDNRPSTLTGETLAKSNPDGYTLLTDGSSLWVGTLLRKAVYDPVKDFSAITLAESFPFVLVVNASVPAKSVSELIALAKAKPGELNYASGGIGGGNHLGGELFKAMAGINIVRVDYKSGSVALTAVIAGEVQLMVNPPASAEPQIKAGKLRALAVTSAQPSPLAPGLPTVAASGLPGYEVVSLTGMLAPKGTPERIVNRLNQDIVRVLTKQDIKEKVLATGAEVVGSSPSEFALKIRSEIAKWGKLFKDAGIRSE